MSWAYCQGPLKKPEPTLRRCMVRDQAITQSSRLQWKITPLFWSGVAKSIPVSIEPTTREGSMFTLMVRTNPRGFAMAIALVALATPSFFPNAAWADKVDLPSMSQSSLMASCHNAGGAFESNDSGFSCKTGVGSVSCSTGGKCTGECATCGPAIRPKGGISGVLSGTAQKAGANTPPVHGPGSSHNPIVATPVENHPVILERSGEEHSGKH